MKQLDLFDWTPPRALMSWQIPIEVIHRGMVRMSTNYVDGKPAWWASRFDYAAMADGCVGSVNHEEAGPFWTPKDADAPFGPETKWPNFKRLEARAKEIAAHAQQ